MKILSTASRMKSSRLIFRSASSLKMACRKANKAKRLVQGS